MQATMFLAVIAHQIKLKNICIVIYTSNCYESCIACTYTVEPRYPEFIETEWFIQTIKSFRLQNIILSKLQ